jgi:regulator of replication initiation timing
MEQEIPILHPLSSVVKEVTVTQEPAPSNNMTVTQEPSSSQNLAVTQEPTAQEEIVPQEPVMSELVVTQEPAAQEETVPQEPVMPELVVTQEPVTKNSEDNDDVPLAQLFSQIEKKIQGTKNSRISELMKENDRLKAELDSLKKELQVARQRNPEESTLDILAQATVVMNENREHMCYECGNIYFQVGYKIVKVLVTGPAEEPTKFSVKKE